MFSVEGGDKTSFEEEEEEEDWSCFQNYLINFDKLSGWVKTERQNKYMIN